MTVNGKEIVLQEKIALKDFLEQQGYDIKRVAVEINGEIVSRAKFESHMLCDGDKIEIVNFVGGG